MTAYDDVKPALEAALAKNETIILTAPSPAAAIVWRRRAYTFRELERRKSKDIYPKDHPSYGHCPYDVLQIRLDGPTILVERIGIHPFPMRTESGEELNPEEFKA